MAFFDTPDELERKAALKRLEDKRLALANKLNAEGFAPEKMLFTQNEDGGFTALCRFNGKYWLIISPGFGTDDEFIVESYDRLIWRTQEVHVKSEGMGGIFGFGKKAELGRQYIITRHDGSEAVLSFVSGRNCWMEATLAKNPLLKAKRRRGDANLVWDMTPLDRTALDRVLKAAEPYFE